MRFIVPHVVTHQRAGHAELDIGVDVRVGRVVNLGDQDLETLFDDQRVQVGGQSIPQTAFVWDPIEKLFEASPLST